jgi:hypothetical protein
MEESQIRKRFLESFHADLIATRAEQYLKEKTWTGNSCFTFSHSTGGLIGYTIRRLLLEELGPTPMSEELLLQLTRDCGFSAEWLPLKILAREALALTVHRQKVITRIQAGLDTSKNLNAFFDFIAGSIPTAETAFSLNDVQVEAIIVLLRSHLRSQV